MNFTATILVGVGPHRKLGVFDFGFIGFFGLGVLRVSSFRFRAAGSRLFKGFRLGLRAEVSWEFLKGICRGLQKFGALGLNVSIVWAWILSLKYNPEHQPQAPNPKPSTQTSSRTSVAFRTSKQTLIPELKPPNLKSLNS